MMWPFLKATFFRRAIVFVALLLARPDNSAGRLVWYQLVRTPMAARFRQYSARLTPTPVRR